MVFLSMEDSLEIGIVQITYFAQKMKFSIMNLCSKYEQICRKLQIWSHLLKKFWMESFIFLYGDMWENETHLVSIPPFIN